VPPRGYALVIFFWALLTVITPTLIFLSASGKQSHHTTGEAIYDPKMSRRMMVGIIENGPLKNIIPRTAARGPTLAPVPAPALVTGNDRLANRTSIV
ncbi:unnamed protein product, partial [Musa hybrid cultivar]